MAWHVYVQFSWPWPIPYHLSLVRALASSLERSTVWPRRRWFRPRPSQRGQMQFFCLSCLLPKICLRDLEWRSSDFALMGRYNVQHQFQTQYVGHNVTADRCNLPCRSSLLNTIQCGYHRVQVLPAPPCSGEPPAWDCIHALRPYGLNSNVPQCSQ